VGQNPTDRMKRDFQRPGRSAVIACEGMAATAHPLASLCAVTALQSGGNAADAAVAAAAALSVLEPHMSGIGGDCFCLAIKPGAPAWGYNGSGRSAAGLRPASLFDQGVVAIEAGSVHAVTVPGAVEAWGAILKAHGRYGLDRALKPAIQYAEHGFPVAPRVAWDWQEAEGLLRADAGAARHFLRDGRAPGAGTVVRLEALAESLKSIAAGGPEAFYQGAIAADIVATVAARGGALTRDDFAAHRGDVVTPIRAPYRDLDILELPPNGQGVAALLLLKLLERFDLQGLDPLGPDRFHLALEAARLACAVRDAEVGDPAFMRREAAYLLDAPFVAALAARIDPRAHLSGPMILPRSDTTTLTVVDRDRMAVSLICSLYRGFGVGIATERTGILLHNRGAGFVVDPTHPNAIGPGKRPLHTIIPGLAMKNDRCELAFGVMGGSFQVMGHAHLITNLVDYGMDVQAAIDCPRAFFEADKTVLEHGIPASTAAGLSERGHDVVRALRPLGGGQAIHINWRTGTLIGGSDPRKDGAAIGY
jgi:gamma-glutamyltranspeptidase / glutathione hydrolase